MSAIAQIGSIHLIISRIALSRSPESSRWERLSLTLAGNSKYEKLSDGVLNNSPVWISIAIDREIKPEWTEFYGYLSELRVADGEIKYLIFNLMEMPV